MNLSEAVHKILSLSETCVSLDEVPVASLIFQTESEPRSLVERILNDDPVLIPLSSGMNTITGRNDPTAHAEILAIQNACAQTGSERLSHGVMVTTLEPCIMCSGALILSRMELVIYLSPALKGLGMRTIIEQNREGEHRFNHYPLLIHEKRYEADAAKILRDFFREKRRKGAAGND